VEATRDIKNITLYVLLIYHSFVSMRFVHLYLIL